MAGQCVQGDLCQSLSPQSPPGISAADHKPRAAGWLYTSNLIFTFKMHPLILDMNTTVWCRSVLFNTLTNSDHIYIIKSNTSVAGDSTNHRYVHERVKKRDTHKAFRHPKPSAQNEALQRSSLAFLASGSDSGGGTLTPGIWGDNTDIMST